MLMYDEDASDGEVKSDFFPFASLSRRFPPFCEASVQSAMMYIFRLDERVARVLFLDFLSGYPLDSRFSSGLGLHSMV